MLEAYLDESERAGQAPRLFCMAGWLGDGAAAWKSFEKRWADVLDDGGITEFKASDLANQRGEFAQWSDERAFTFLADLLAIVRDSDLVAVEASIALEEPQDRRIQAQAGADYLACAYHCLLLLLHVATIKDVGGRERVSVVFDERKYKGVALLGVITYNLGTLLRRFALPLTCRVGR